MNTKRVDGALIGKMFFNGLSNLRANKEKLNRMNVFPVADGDTGTNMCLTLESGLKSAKSAKELGSYLRSFGEGLLYGARGNSGVILSQLFSGFCTELNRLSAAGSAELKNAFIRGYKTAYSSVIRPVEGTILTVAREGIEHIRPQLRRDTSVEQFLSLYIAEMRKSLAHTPELLPDLKEAGVVDSGALGYILIIEGMLKYLYGEIIDSSGDDTELAPSSPDFSLFDENSPFLEGYCMEFILQRMLNSAYDPSFRLPAYIKELETLGNSIVAVENGHRVKVHIHTRVPARIMELSQRYGEFLSFKLENMQLQHNEKLAAEEASRERVDVAVISVVNGEGMKEVFTGVGAQLLLDGGPSMNTPTQEFSEAFKKLNAKRIVVLPNDKNILPSAKQALELSKLDNITIIPTENMVEGYFSLAMDVPDSSDVDYRVRQMMLGTKDLNTISVTKSVRDSFYHGIHCKAGDYLAFHKGDLVAVDSNCSQLILAVLSSLAMDEKSACVLFRGRDADENQEEILAKNLELAYPDIELSFIQGGQSVYPWLIGII